MCRGNAFIKKCRQFCVDGMRGMFQTLQKTKQNKQTNTKAKQNKTKHKDLVKQCWNKIFKLIPNESEITNV